MQRFLLLLMALAAFSGCIENDDAAESEPAGTDSTPEAAAGETAPAESPCETFTNYGVMVTLEDTIVVTGEGPDDTRVYENDNGMAGLQTEETCPANHDTRVA